MKPKIDRRFLITAAVAFTPFVLQAKQKNVLFIAVDDMKPNLGAYGDPMAITPNMDRLAQKGTVFTNNHCQQAVCSPSRASLMTGLRPDKTRVWDLKTPLREAMPEMKTIPMHFIENGYEAAAIGKIFHMSMVDKNHDSKSWTLPYIRINGPQYQKNGNKVSSEILDLPDSVYEDSKICDGALSRMEKMAKGRKPFFLAVGFKKPHLPFVAPKRFWDMYERTGFKIAPFQQYAKGSPEFAFQPGWELRNGYDDIPKEGPIPEKKQIELIRAYYSCITMTDFHIGRLMNKLEELGIANETIIVVWGDHGWHLGDHGMWCKHTNFEQATRSPLIFSSPDLEGGNKNNSPTEFVDIYPTLCDLAGLPVPAGLDGTSLVPLMKGEKTSVKEFAISQYPRTPDKMGYALRTERYRYVEWHKNEYRSYQPFNEKNIEAVEMYDYQADPLETENLAGNKRYASVEKELKNKLDNFLKNQAK